MIASTVLNRFTSPVPKCEGPAAPSCFISLAAKREGLGDQVVRREKSIEEKGGVRWGIGVFEWLSRYNRDALAVPISVRTRLQVF